MRSTMGCLAACMIVAGSASAEGPAQPNVIVVFIDDMGWSDLSCFGGDETTTQHIDRVAEEGLRFTNFYVNAPICSPSRVALTTGQYPQRWRITSYLNNRRSNRRRGVAQWLDTRAPVLARQLRKAGYATGHFGKWHMGGQRNVDDAPPIADYGFDVSLTNFEGMGPKLLPLTMQPGWERPGRIWGGAIRLGGPAVWMQRSRITGGYVQSALSFIDDALRRQKPFYVNVWPDDVHSPFFPPVERWDEDLRARYLAVLDTMDEQLAPLFDRVRNSSELKNNTLIVFCSDNGPQHNAGSSKPLRGAKTWLYEGGVRSPLIVWGPGLVAPGAAGTTNQRSVLSAIDVNRSLYEICEVDLPDGVKLDGEDLAATLLGRAKESRQQPILWRRPPDRPGFGDGFQEDNPDLAARDGKWKYYVNYDGGEAQLYDLDADVSETVNVASENPAVTERLHQSVMQWNASMPADSGAQGAGRGDAS